MRLGKGHPQYVPGGKRKNSSELHDKASFSRVTTVEHTVGACCKYLNTLLSKLGAQDNDIVQLSGLAGGWVAEKGNCSTLYYQEQRTRGTLQLAWASNAPITVANHEPVAERGGKQFLQACRGSSFLECLIAWRQTSAHR